MPLRRKVPSLQTLSLRSVGCIIERVAHEVPTKNNQYEIIQQISVYLNMLMNCVPHYLYEKIAEEVMDRVGRVVQKTSPSIKKMNFLGRINRTMLIPQLKSLKISVWPRRGTRELYPDMRNLTGLEKLEIASLPRIMRTEEIRIDITESISEMRKLKSFTFKHSCTDAIVQAIGNHCRDIEYLDINGSNLVTNRSIPQLLKCSKLKILKIIGTAISYDVMAQIIIGLPNLIETEYGDIDLVVKRLENLGCGPFGLRKALQWYHSKEGLNVFVGMFPKTEYILFHRPISDLPILASLVNLKTLLLRKCEINNENFTKLLKAKGGNITSLFLEGGVSVGIQNIIDIGRYCPNLTSLGLVTCKFTNSVMPSGRFDGPLFKNLRKVYYVGNGGIAILEFVLSHAFHIQVIDLTYLPTFPPDITHSFVENVLSANPMRYLEEFSVSHSTDLTMRTVEMLLASCANLKVLSRLKRWTGIQKRELKAFKKYIASHNFDLQYVCSPRPAESSQKSFVENGLSANPMKDLEEFSVSHSMDLTIRTVEILLESCANLKVLSCLEKWTGIRMKELTAFKKYIAFHNFDLQQSKTK